MIRSFFCLVLITLIFLPNAARADGPTEFLQRALALEIESIEILSDNYRLEGDLAISADDRFVVLFSVSEGRPIVLRDAILYLDNVPVLKYPFSVAQMQVLMRRGVHRLFDARIPAGKHSIRLELKAVQGTLPPMATYAFTKGRSAKFIEFQLYGEAPRKIDVIEW